MKSVIPKNCLQCNKRFDARRVDVKRGHAKFCSRSCSSKYRSLNSSSPQNNVTCATCGIGVYRKPSQIKNSKNKIFFCSRVCKEKAQQIDTVYSIPEIQPNHYGNKISIHSYRVRALKELGESCNRCGYNEYKKVLQVHHKDRDRLNNSIENLEVLCPTCHMVEHFMHGDGLWN